MRGDRSCRFWRRKALPILHESARHCRNLWACRRGCTWPNRPLANWLHPGEQRSSFPHVVGLYEHADANTAKVHKTCAHCFQGAELLERARLCNLLVFSQAKLRLLVEHGFFCCIRLDRILTIQNSFHVSLSRLAQVCVVLVNKSAETPALGEIKSVSAHVIIASSSSSRLHALGESFRKVCVDIEIELLVVLLLAIAKPGEAANESIHFHAWLVFLLVLLAEFFIRVCLDCVFVAL
mmetsp:Transcript_9755/g.24682  ORF Transcript_9755/g.24682 Transcript_9755/m.24682 type:complete len:237 (+) Transcript_9755:55-765(+)